MTLLFTDVDCCFGLFYPVGCRDVVRRFSAGVWSGVFLAQTVGGVEKYGVTGEHAEIEPITVLSVKPPLG